MSQDRPLCAREQFIETSSRPLNSLFRLQQSFQTMCVNYSLRGAIRDAAVTIDVKDCGEAKGRTRLIFVSKLAVACFDFDKVKIILAQLLIVTGSVVGTNLQRKEFSICAQKRDDFSLETRRWWILIENYLRDSFITSSASQISALLSYTLIALILCLETGQVASGLVSAKLFLFLLTILNIFLATSCKRSANFRVNMV